MAALLLRTLTRKNLLKTYLLRPNHPTSPIHPHSEIQSHLVPVFPSPPFWRIWPQIELYSSRCSHASLRHIAVKTPAKVTSHVVIYPGFHGSNVITGRDAGLARVFFL